MKKLGRLHTIAKNGLLVVESMVRTPEKIMGAIVYDKDMRKIGVVADVLGRVDHPYLVVKPDSKELIEELSIGTILYYYIPRRGRRGKRVRGGRGRKRRR